MKYILSKAKRAEILKRAKNNGLRALLGAYAILSSPKRHKKEAMAYTSDGDEVAASDARACSFCLMGGVERAKLELGLDTLETTIVFDNLSKNYIPRGLDGDPQCVSTFNDRPSTTFKDVKRVLAKAIKRESRGRIVFREAVVAE